MDPEKVHLRAVALGERLGKNALAKKFIGFWLRQEFPELKQKISGIDFALPVGLSAGFDYEARLTQILPAVGFGFTAVGTITNQPYEGNPRPMLGRLIKSGSLMVYKGFKNLGATATAAALAPLKFSIPIGVSIGRTNSRALTTQAESVADIIAAFKIFESSLVRHAYYELNISCPNLFGDISFYPLANLEELLVAIDDLKLSRPVFVKMPIEKTDEEARTLLEVIARHSPVGVIFGNLQKNRDEKTFVSDEIQQWPKGGFSGRPTWDRSNELISLTHKEFGQRFVIIGCGGIFSAADAYEKIKRGASLLQLITGLIFVGPQLIAQINSGLVDLLRRDGYKNISEAVGQGNKK